MMQVDPVKVKIYEQGDTAMQKKKRVFLAEDHILFRDRLMALLNENPDLEVVGEAADGLDAIRYMRDLAIDIAILDLSMPRMDGFSVIRETKRHHPNVKIIALTMHKDEEHVLEAFKAGANGYCLKSSSQEEFILAIRAVLSGKIYVSPEVSERIMEGYVGTRARIKEKPSWDTLTRREKEVLKLVAGGYRNKQIAGLLFITVKTIEKHRANIMQKLDLHNASNLTAYAIEKGLVMK